METICAMDTGVGVTASANDVDAICGVLGWHSFLSLGIAMEAAAMALALLLSRRRLGVSLILRCV